MDEIEIVDFEPKYANSIDEIEKTEWYAKGVLDKYEENWIMRVAIKDSEVVGAIYGKIMGDLFILDVLIIKKEYRNKGIGRNLLNNLLDVLKEKGLKSILVTAVFSNGKMNIEGLMKGFNFREIFRVKGWWGSKYPEEDCKVCKYKPCECTCVFFLKEI